MSTALPQARNLEVNDQVKVRVGKRGEYTTSPFMRVIEVWSAINFVTENEQVHHIRHIRAWKGPVSKEQHEILNQINTRLVAKRIAMGGFAK